MSARRPARPAPKAAKAPKSGGAKGASKGRVKSGAKGNAKGNAKGGAKPRAGAAGKTAPPKGAPKGKQPPAGPNAEQDRLRRVMLEQQRLQRESTWWARNQAAVNRLHDTQHHSAGGEAIGTILNGDRRLRWRTSHAVGAITLLILTAFFASMALGARSVGVAVLAFMCLAGCIAFVTVEHSARRFPRPVPVPPLIGEHRLEDLIVEDDLPKPKDPDAAPVSMDALNDLFDEPSPAPPVPESEPAAVTPVAEPETRVASQRPVEPEAVAATAVEAIPETEAAAEPEALTEPETVATAVEASAPAAGPPAPPRQRTSPETRALPEDIGELLLSDQHLDESDVTDVASTLIVADLQRSVVFYTEALGLRIVDRTEEAAVLEAGFGKILLWERPDAPPGEAGIMHLTFEVGDLDTAFEQMNEAGVEFLHMPRTALLGQNYELRAASFRDPDGHGLAITEHRER